MNLVLKINEIIKELGYDETPEVSVSNRPDISDYQYNGAFKLAKTMHKSPMVIADEIVSKLKNNDMFITNLRYFFEHGAFRFKDLKSKEALLKCISY